MAAPVLGLGTSRAPACRTRWLALVGLLGPVTYVFALILGGALWPGYSHYSESISTLTSSGAPNQVVLVPLFALYNLCLLALAIGLQGGTRQSRWGTAGPFFLAAAGISGLVLFFFPQGPWAAPLSGTGVQHTIVAGIDALCFLLALGFLWRRFLHDPAWAGLARFTLVMLLLGIAFGGFGAASVTASYAGLAERLSIGVFLVWTEIIALGLFRAAAEGTRLATGAARVSSLS